MLLSNQQKYILEILKEFKYLRVRQLHALVQAHYRTQGIKIDERRMEIMLRQMRTGTNYVWLRGDVVSYGDRRIPKQRKGAGRYGSYEHESGAV